MKEKIKEALLKAGASAVGFTTAGEIDPKFNQFYIDWINKGYNGEMSYLQRHIPLRRHTDSVLPGAQTVISMAFSYSGNNGRKKELPYVSSYAFGEDYHLKIREILLPVINYFKHEFGGNWRLCIDSAPVAERFWALKSGIGKLGLNGCVIIENAGSFCFLAEILTSISLPPDYPSSETCCKCRKCLQICPSKALKGDGSMDATKCLNYLTIEKKGEFSEPELLSLSSGNGYFFGCDRCLQICPHNNPGFNSETRIDLFHPINKDISPQDILSVNAKEFDSKYKGTPFAYAGYERLWRNALAIQKSD